MFAKIMVVVNLILAVIFLAAAGTLHGAAESWKTRHESMKTNLEAQIAASGNALKAKDNELNAARDAQRSSETRAGAAEAVQKNLNESNAALMAEIARLKAENEKLVANGGDLAKTIQDLNGRNADLSNQVATATAEKRAAQDENATLKENLARETARADDAEKNVAAGEVARTKLSDDLDRTSTELTAYKKAYPPLGAASSAKAVSGVVSAASAKDDVYVISVGSKDHVEVGYEFTVFRGSEYVSTIVVDMVYPTYSAGRTKPGMKKSDVKPGDSVTTKL